MKQMDDAVRQGVERLFSACLELSASGRRLAFFDWSPHVGDIDIHVYDGAASWREGQPTPACELTETISVYGARAGHPDITRQKLEILTARISALLKEASP